MRALSTTLIVAALVWPVVLGAATWQLAIGHRPVWAGVVYAAASRVCHQRSERSFHTDGVKWPVCGRCSGLYIAAPFGALAAGIALRRQAKARRQLLWLAVAAVPTAVTLGLEWLQLASVTNVDRAISALPLGVMIAFVVVRAAAGES
jgi:uncharacterized membrane protein